MVLPAPHLVASALARAQPLEPPAAPGVALVEGLSWRAELSVAIRSCDFAAADTPVTSWSLSTAAGPIWSLRGAALDGGAVGAVSLPLVAQPLKVHSFNFPQPGQWRGDLLRRAAAAPSEKPLPAIDASSPQPRTRIKPPGEAIRLEDRLFYVLQPSLESLIGEGSLAFPFHPFPYQLEGVAFLYPRYAAVLADEMGLGKTMQAITALRLLLHTGELTSALLVCPKPLVTNWQREFALWAPEVPLMVIEGDQPRRRWQWEQTDLPLKIANYELLARDRDVVAQLGLTFDLVVLDEAQRIKNRSSVTSSCVRELSRRRSWALTGTPVENSPQDLVGIFEFLVPGHLSQDMKPREMGRAVGDYVLRRTKDKVLTELPPKMFRDADVELTAEQRASYRLAEEEGVLQLTEMGDAATIQHVFELVLRLKQICNFDPATGASAKFERLSADLDEVAASGRKAIVFSQWVGTLDELARRLKALNPVMYHGRVSGPAREQALVDFKEDPRRHVMLLSYGAGGVGLNLQFAEYVFLFDRWWNPAVEDQAINRAHRIGAAGPLTVTRFLARDTIEERIDQVLREKRALFDAIFDDVEPQQMGLTQHEIFGLFQLRSPQGPIRLAG